MSGDPVALSLFASRVAAICEEMGAALGRTAISPNIRDRLDFSCALFDRDGRLLGQATHIPVHLGSMAYAMGGLVSGRAWRPGDVLVVNDPYRGGTHLPDVTLLAPVYHGGRRVAFCANRAHHADIGASAPGSMPISRSLDEEGLIVPPTLLANAEGDNRELLESWLGRVARPDVTRGDLAAQRTALRIGARRLGELLDGIGSEFGAMCSRLNDYAERLALAHFRELPAGTWRFADQLDDDGLGHTDLAIELALTTANDGLVADFSGTAPQVAGNVNCPRPVTAAAVHYVLRCLLPAQIPACDGALRRVEIRTEPGSLVDARPPAAVAAGNVETSQRIVDVMCGALARAIPDRVPAASQGTMNNIAMGGRGAEAWDYYETLAGGHGGGPGWHGRDARHSHMTNTLNTPVEILERHYPLRVRHYAVRRDSGGAGRWRGGDGVVRAFEFLARGEVSLISERRRHAPWGLEGGGAGARGRNRLDGHELPAKCAVQVHEGQVLEIETPGGGGWGDAVKR